MGKTAIWRFILAAIAGSLVAGAGEPAGVGGAGDDPFEFLAPSVVVSQAERERLERDETVVRALPGSRGQLAIFVATRLNAPPDSLVAWTRQIPELKRSRFVQAIGRFSDLPTLADLDGLSLDERDVEAIRECVPGDCRLKLSAPEIESLKSAAAAGGTGWRDAVQHEFRGVVIGRMDLYRTGGLGALPPIADRRTPKHLDEAAAAILANSPYLERLPNVGRWLRTYPHVDDPGIESFFYWSKEHYGRGKPVISVTHVGIVHPEQGYGLPAVLVVARQILATHYVEGALGLTMVVRDAAKGRSYLVYVNRSQLDLLRSSFAGLFRGTLEGRVERDAPEVVRGLRARLESGHPPQGPPGSRSTSP